MRTAVYDIGTIRVPEGHRALDEDTVASLMQSIGEFGLIHPIVVEVSLGEGGILLVAGRHRLEACRRLGHTLIEAVNVYSLLTEDDPEEARLVRPIIEIQENLYRLDTTARRRAEKRLLMAQEALSRYRADRAAKAEQKAQEQAGQKAEEFQDNVSQNPSAKRPTKPRAERMTTGKKGGRPRNAAKDAVSKAMGVSRRTFDRDQQKPEPPERQREEAEEKPVPADPKPKTDELARAAEHELQESLYDRCVELWRGFPRAAEFLDAYRGLNSPRKMTFWRSRGSA